MKAPDLSEAPLREQITKRIAAESKPAPHAPVSQSKTENENNGEELDRVIHLRLPSAYGYAIRNHAVKKREKVNQTIFRAIREYMERNGIEPSE